MVTGVLFYYVIGHLCRSIMVQVEYLTYTPGSEFQWRAHGGGIRSVWNDAIIGGGTGSLHSNKWPELHAPRGRITSHATSIDVSLVPFEIPYPTPPKIEKKSSGFKCQQHNSLLRMRLKGSHRTGGVACPNSQKRQ